jgi:hypothetical protein
MLSLLQKNHFHAPPVLNIFGLAWTFCPVRIRAGTVTPALGGEGSGLSNSWMVLIGSILLGAAVVTLVIVMVLKKRNNQKRELEWNQKVGGLGESASVDETPVDPGRTLDGREINPAAFGVLTVMTSDDPSMPGRRFEITSRVTTLGRKSDNQIIFSKDSPVSRHHALIEEKDGRLFLSEVQEVGEKTDVIKRPTYGTFINEKQVGEQAVPLQNGDEIRLGKRVCLKFETGRLIRAADEKTFDSFTATSDTIETRVK